LSVVIVATSFAWPSFSSSFSCTCWLSYCCSCLTKSSDLPASAWVCLTSTSAWFARYSSA
jgi:hypothetical protein